MENLLNLLKQYWKETFGDEKLSKIEYEEKSDCFYWIYQPLPWMKLEQGQILDSSTVLSKKFQFIWWLVENNKIDFNKLEKIWYIGIVYGYDWQYKKIVEYPDYESLLMLLSISDTPIEDLVSYLR